MSRAVDAGTRVSGMAVPGSTPCKSRIQCSRSGGVLGSSPAMVDRLSGADRRLERAGAWDSCGTRRVGQNGHERPQHIVREHAADRQVPSEKQSAASSCAARRNAEHAQHRDEGDARHASVTTIEASRTPRKRQNRRSPGRGGYALAR
jgi:hypothetical protein